MPKVKAARKPRIRSEIHVADSLGWMWKQAGNSFDLVIADPPFNFKMDYGSDFDDDRPLEEYREWTRRWIHLAVGLLDPHGAICVFAPDEHVAHAFTRLEDEGLHLRNWIVWHYTFGANCSKKFGRAHTHILCFTKHASKFTFNAPAVAVPSSRQLVYADPRAAEGGRTPQDVWLLRPQEAPDHFSPGGDVWHVPRLVGNAKERAKTHACQMPVEIVERLVAAFSNPGDKVFDPYAGTCSTGVGAVRLGRHFVGIERNAEYARVGRERIGALGHPIAKKSPEKAK